MIYFAIAWVVGWLAVSIWQVWREARYRRVPAYEVLGVALLLFFLWPIPALQFEIGRKP